MSKRPALPLSPLRPGLEPERGAERRTEVDQALTLASGESFHESFCDSLANSSCKSLADSPRESIAELLADSLHDSPWGRISNSLMDSAANSVLKSFHE
jgi:hypothetical protein